jgi:hypothetical protein
MNRMIIIKLCNFYTYDYHDMSHTSLSPIRRGFAPGFVNYKKVCTRLAAASDKSLPVACPGSVVLFGYSGFLHHWYGIGQNEQTRTPLTAMGNLRCSGSVSSEIQVFTILSLNHEIKGSRNNFNLMIQS